jgi:hypothetical protein
MSNFFFFTEKKNFIDVDRYSSDRVAGWHCHCCSRSRVHEKQEVEEEGW